MPPTKTDDRPWLHESVRTVKCPCGLYTTEHWNYRECRWEPDPNHECRYCHASLLKQNSSENRD